MTEAEWLACDEPCVMWNYLRARETEVARRSRLFLTACSRRVWHLVVDPRSREAVLMAERLADGVASEDDRATCELAASQAADNLEVAAEAFLDERLDGEILYLAGFYDAVARSSAADAAARCVLPSDRLRATGTAFREMKGVVAAAALAAAGAVYDAALGTDGNETVARETRTGECSTQAALLRDIFGNPFRPVAFSPVWRTSTVIALAKQMYDTRDFSPMPILADALQDAGCENTDILDHCRGPGPHVRGCWVVDLVLGKA